MKFRLLAFVLLLSLCGQGQFRFAFISDTHIGSPNGGAEEDLRRTVADINSMNDIAFVVITGDITELGTDAQLRLAKQILDSLNKPWYIIPGNHDTGWSESGGLSFSKIFGDDKFQFSYQGIQFLGCASGPYVRMSDGHIPCAHVNWMKQTISKIEKNTPVVFLNHYPLDNGLDNWYEMIDLLKTKNTVLALCGHGHSNRPVQAELIPAVMGRSNLRAKASEGGYNLVDWRKDSIVFTERKPVSHSEKHWTAVANKNQMYDQQPTFPRPDFSINMKYPQVKAVWTYASAANVISTPAVLNDQYALAGNQNGDMECLDLNTGKVRWKYQTKGPIFSSPAISNNTIVFGSADGEVYALTEKGQLKWKYHTAAAVLGSPVIENNTVFIGGSDHRFRAIDLATGKIKWEWEGLNGPMTSQPVLAGNTVIAGAWDNYLYAWNKENGQLLWKWTNGSTVINFSPAACIPVVHNYAVFIAAPDRYLTAISLDSGHTLWRTKEAMVRESIGISADGQTVYGKTMQDTIVAYSTQTDHAQLLWKMHAGFGYEHTPSMLIEKDGVVVFGTRSGVIYAIDPQLRQIRWAYKIDNSMVNTVRVLNGHRVLASTMDGKIVLLLTD